MNVESKKLRIILTGTTGMVGEGVLFECLTNPAIEHVLIVNCRPYPKTDPKLTQIIVPDFMVLDAVLPQLTGYDACFYCAGITSFGMSEADYTRITYDITMHFAKTVAGLNPRMVFIFVSGMQTDSTEKGRLMWARVKGKTENALMKLGFKAVFNFRPGGMKAMPGQQNLKWTYKSLGWLYPVFHLLLPNQVSTLRDVASAMIKCAMDGYPKSILEVKDINALART